MGLKGQPLILATGRISGGVGAGPTEVNYGASVRPRRSLVGSLNFEYMTLFHGLAKKCKNLGLVG